MHDSSGSSHSVLAAGRGTPPLVEEAVSLAPTEEPLSTVALDGRHAVEGFDCVRSERVNTFIRSEAQRWINLNYCRVFVLENPDDPTALWGYYTLSAALLVRNEISTQLQKKVIPRLPIPLIRIGFMGRHKDAPKKLGAALITDAARRVSRNADIAAWGLILDAEGGSNNPSLMARYTDIGFKTAKTQPGVMYGPLKSFLG